MYMKSKYLYIDYIKATHSSSQGAYFSTVRSNVKATIFCLLNYARGLFNVLAAPGLDGWSTLSDNADTECKLNVGVIQKNSRLGSSRMIASVKMS